MATELSLKSVSKDKNGPRSWPEPYNGTERSAAEVDATTTMNLKTLSLIVVESMTADEHRHVNKRAKTGAPVMGFSKKRALSVGEQTSNTAEKSKASAPACQVRSSEGNWYRYRRRQGAGHGLSKPTSRFPKIRNGDL